MQNNFCEVGDLVKCNKWDRIGLVVDKHCKQFKVRWFKDNSPSNYYESWQYDTLVEILSHANR